jgi:hypothetical protein
MAHSGGVVESKQSGNLEGSAEAAYLRTCLELR